MDGTKRTEEANTKKNVFKKSRNTTGNEQLKCGSANFSAAFYIADVNLDLFCVYFYGYYFFALLFVAIVRCLNEKTLNYPENRTPNNGKRNERKKTYVCILYK